MMEDFYFGPHELSDPVPHGDPPAPAYPATPAPPLASGRPDPAGNCGPLPASMHAITAPENVAEAWERVRRNRGCAGVDRQTISALEPCFPAVWQQVEADLHAGRWHPLPLLRASIPKCSGGVRLLGIPTVLDRVVAQAAAQVLSPLLEPRFSPWSYAYRRGRGAVDALRHVRAAVAGGRAVCLHADITSFFDTIPHGPLLEQVAAAPCTPEVLETVARLLRAPVCDAGRLLPVSAGVAQGSPLSPLLANLTLDPLDHWLSDQGAVFARYADDVIVLCRTVEEAARLQEAMTERLATTGLALSGEKTRISPPEEASFLGYTFRRDGPGTCRLAVSPAALEACREHLRHLGPGPGAARFLTSWRAYFGHSEEPADWQSICAWAESVCGCRPEDDTAPPARRSPLGYSGHPAPVAHLPPRPAPHAASWVRLLHRVAAFPVRVSVETGPGRGFLPRFRGVRLSLWGYTLRFRL